MLLQPHTPPCFSFSAPGLSFTPLNIPPGICVAHPLTLLASALSGTTLIDVWCGHLTNSDGPQTLNLFCWCHQENMNRLIAHITGLSGEGRVGPQACPKMTWKRLVQLSLWEAGSAAARSPVHTEQLCALWHPREEHWAFSLACQMWAEAERGPIGVAWKSSVVKHQEWSQTLCYNVCLLVFFHGFIFLHISY